MYPFPHLLPSSCSSSLAVSSLEQAAEKAHQLLKSSRDQALADLRAGMFWQPAPVPPELDVDSLALSGLRADPPPPTQPLYQPIFLASATRNVKVIALAVSALQRLIASGAVPKARGGRIARVGRDCKLTYSGFTGPREADLGYP